MNAFFVSQGTPNTAIDSMSGACPPPVTICPHIAARLHPQYRPPLMPLVFDDVEK